MQNRTKGGRTCVGYRTHRSTVNRFLDPEAGIQMRGANCNDDCGAGFPACH
jgi:hypothetical protein